MPRPPIRSRASGQPRGTFAALRVPAFRMFLIGQAVSLPGTWMQTVAQGWLVLQLTGSGTLLGAVTAAQYVPVLLLAPWGGVLADRHPRRLLLMGTQTLMAGCALTLGLLTVTGLVTVPWLFVVAIVFGCATAVDNPTRQSFVLEMVGPDLVRNAVSLNSALLNSARAVGPAIAGVIIVAIGPGWCFLINAVSFIAIVLGLARMRLRPVKRTPAGSSPLRQLREGLQHVLGERELLWPTLGIFVVGCLAWEFPITLPLLASGTFHGDARTYGWLTSAMGLGAVLGALAVAGRGTTGLRPIARSAAVFGIAMIVLAAAPTLLLAVVALIGVGWGGASFLSISNATIQLASAEEYRGRVMAMWSLCFIGSTPIGSPIIGVIGEHLSPRWAIATGAAACLATGCALALVGRKERH